MPEVIEVTQFANSLREYASGKILISIDVLDSKYLTKKSSANSEMYDKLRGELPLIITRVCSKGKFCWMVLDNCDDRDDQDDYAGSGEDERIYIGFTFGLKGKFVMGTFEKSQVRFNLDDGTCFNYYDQIRFGNVTIMTKAKLTAKLATLGTDPLNETITLEDFIKKFTNPRVQKSNICTVLMDQRIIAGIGNHIKTSVLYKCKISPWALVEDLNLEHLEQLYYCIINTVTLSSSYQLTDIYGQQIDMHGNIVSSTRDFDNRITYYVSNVQTIGNHRISQT